MKARIDINCDLGEGFGVYSVGNDEKIMRYITSANIACGFHAGDSMTMAKTINLANRYGVAVGAHVGFPDILGFGRREMQLNSEEIRNYTIHQIGTLEGFAEATGLSIQHVKPHGALYNMLAKDEKLSKSLTEGIKAINSDLVVFAQPNSALATIAAKEGLRVAYEFFADRAYNPDGSLVSRVHANAIIKEPKRVVERAVKAVREGVILAVNRKTVRLGKLHTICVHSDTPKAVRLAEQLKKGLNDANIEVTRVDSFI